MNSVRLHAETLHHYPDGEFRFMIEVRGSVAGKLHFATPRPFAVGTGFVDIATEWCEKNCVYSYWIDEERSIYFAHEDDAVLFKMRFA